MSLTPLEMETVGLIGLAWNNIARLVGEDESRSQDLREMAHHIHALQNAILAQSAARSYPDKYRLMGESIGTQA